MPACPRCREAIKEDATKCPHCGADLAARGAVPGDVILIVDRGLVRFGKFALGLFGLFFVFGVVLFGLDIKKLAKEMEEQRSELQVTNTDLKTRSAEAVASVQTLGQQVRAAQAEVETRAQEFKGRLAAAQKEVEKLRSSVAYAEAALRRIRAAERRVNVAVSNIVELSAEEIKQIEARADASETGQSTARRNPKLFDPGQKIPIAFLDEASPEVRAVIKAAYTKWEKYANLDFYFIDKPSAAVVRIGFEPGGSWAFVGQDAVKIPVARPTMNFGWDITAPDQQDTVLSEFGHVIGFPNEHMNPRNGIVWNEKAVYAHFSGPPNNWARSMIEFNILRKLPLDEYPCSRNFDPNSIMMYPFPAGLTADGAAIVPTPGLSDSDKKCAAEMYP